LPLKKIESRASRVALASAAKASALQMAKERAARRRAAGKPALLPLSYWPQAHGGRDSCYDTTEREPMLSQCLGWWGGSEDFWYYGDAGMRPSFKDSAKYDQLEPPVHVGQRFYEGDYALSLKQMIADDLAEQSGMVMQPLQSPDGITTYSPDRLAQVQLAETYHALQAQEEAALQLVAQTQTPGTVARISTTQTVTDPIGRLILGSITQQATGQIPHAATGQEIGQGQGPAPAPAGTTADTVRQLQSGTNGTDGTNTGETHVPLTPTGGGLGTILLAGAALAAMTLLGHK